MAALTTGTTPYSDGPDISFAGAAAAAKEAPPGPAQGVQQSPTNFLVSVLTSNRSLFIFSEENFIRKCAKWLTEWLYPLLQNKLINLINNCMNMMYECINLVNYVLMHILKFSAE